MGGNKLKSIEVLNIYIEGISVAIPTWLKHLIEAEEIHQNYENVQVLGALKTDAVLYYVHRTLQVLDGLSLDEEAYRIIEKVLTYSELAKVGSLKQREQWKKKDMISPAQHERVFRWLYQLSKKVSFDIKTTAGQHYRRVVIQEKMKEHKKEKQVIQYQDVLMNGMTGRVNGLGRAPKGVNDGNGFVFISHIGDVYPSGLLPIRTGNIRTNSLAEIYRNSPVFQNLRNPDKYKGKCGVCEFRYVCGGSRSRAYAMTGDYMESEPFCVYVPKALRKQKKNIKKGHE